jgi:hypothetical protein
VNWYWIGGIVMVLGGILVMLPLQRMRGRSSGGTQPRRAERSIEEVSTRSEAIAVGASFVGNGAIHAQRTGPGEEFSHG